MAPSLTGELPPELKAIFIIDADKRTAEQQAYLLAYYAGIAPSTKPLRDKLEALQKQIAAVPVPQTPVMKELPADKRRPNKVHVRGNFLDQGDAVEAGGARGVSSVPGGNAVESPRRRCVADALGQPADGPRRGQSVLGSPVRPRARGDAGGLRLAGSAAVAPGTARLAGHRVPAEGLVHEGAPASRSCCPRPIGSRRVRPRSY